MGRRRDKIVEGQAPLQPQVLTLEAAARRIVGQRGGTMTELLQVTTTVSSRDEAERIAMALVQQRLAACVHVVGPITSIYRWQGQVETAQEWQCVAKTHRDKYAAIEEAIGQLHDYDVPEILATPIVAGSPDYLQWLRAELKPT